jgi:hypothetical protein
MATKASKSGEPEESSAYATGPDQPGKPVGPEHDGSFHAPDFYDENGQRIETDWDTDQQKADPGIEPVPTPEAPEPAPTAKGDK